MLPAQALVAIAGMLLCVAGPAQGDACRKLSGDELLRLRAGGLTPLPSRPQRGLRLLSVPLGVLHVIV